MFKELPIVALAMGALFGPAKGQKPRAKRAATPMDVAYIQRLAVSVGEGKARRRHEALCQCGKRPKSEKELVEQWKVMPTGKGVTFFCARCWQKVLDYMPTETTEWLEYDREHPVTEGEGDDKDSK